MQNELRYRLSAEDKATAEIRRLADSFLGLDRTLKQASTSIVSLASQSKGLEKMKDPIEKANAEVLRLARTTRWVDGLQSPVTRLTGSFQSLGGAVTMVGTALAAIGSGVVVNGLVVAAIEAEKLQRVLVSVTGSQRAAALEMSFLKSVSSGLGLELRSISNDYIQIAAAAKGTPLEGEKTQKVFKSVATAAAALGLSADDTSGALRALNQMISKGKVQAEELRGQLGERLPGAFQLAARAMGLSTAELDKFMQQGIITAEALLPALARELDKTYGEAGRANADGLAGSINQLKNSFFEFQKVVADGGVTQTMQGLVDITRGWLNLLKDGVSEIKEATTEIVEKYYDKLNGSQVTGKLKSVSDYDAAIADTEKKLISLMKSNDEFRTAPFLKKLTLNSFQGFDLDVAEEKRLIKELKDLKIQREGQRVLEKRQATPNIAKTEPKPSGIEANNTKPEGTQNQNLDAEQRRIREETLRKANEAKVKAEDASNKRAAESIRQKFRTEIEKIQEERRLLDELYAKRDSSGKQFLTEQEYSRADAYLKEKEAISSVDQEMKKMRDEVDQINSSYRTQVERLTEVKNRFEELFNSGAVTDLDTYGETLKRINEEISKAEEEAKKGNPKNDDKWSKLSEGFKESWEDSIRSVGDELKKMVKSGELDLSRLKSAFLDTLTSKLIDKTIDFGINMLLGGAFATGGYPPTSGFYLAGERGPELIAPAGQSHRVFSAPDTREIFRAQAAGGSGSVSPVLTNNITIKGNADESTVLRMFNEIEERTMARLIDYQRRGMA